MLRLIETGWACGGALAVKVVLLARNRVISSVGWTVLPVYNIRHCQKKIFNPI
jgi:hypothetical protein